MQPTSSIDASPDRLPGEAPRCQTCRVRDQALCKVLTSIDELQPHRISMLRRLPQGRLLISGHRPMNWFGIIVSGVVKLMLNDANGRQQIVGLQFPGDYVGSTAANPSALIAEAATRVEICCFPRATFDGLVARNANVGQAMLQHALSELDQARQWMVVLGNKSALERVAAFLLILRKRSAGCAMHGAASAGGQEARARKTGHEVLELPLSRSEMAEYLSLSIETVSRQLKHLRTCGAIETIGRRQVRIIDGDALRAVGGNT